MVNNLVGVVDRKFTAPITNLKADVRTKKLSGFEVRSNHRYGDVIMQTDHKKVLSKLYPPVSYDVNGERFLAQCVVDGTAFDRLAKSAVDLLQIIEPATSNTMLSDWEHLCGI